MPPPTYPDLPGATLTLAELDLYHLLMAYRAENDLDPLPLSAALTATAGYHAHDTLYNIWDAGVTLPEGANLHSWSDAYYYGDHRAPEVMWDAPERIGVDYPNAGYEISAAGYATNEAALAGWQGSPGHDDVILNNNIWAGVPFDAIGVDHDPAVETFQGRIYHVWFGQSADPAGPPQIHGTELDDLAQGTDFDDVLDMASGADDVRLGPGDDVVFGADGADLLRGNTGEDTLHGDAGDDRLRGQKGGDHLEGGAGNDNLKGGGNDVLLGGAGRDFLNGGSRRDRIEGGDGNDKLIGRSFNDTLAGGAGNDALNAGGADDVLEGGAGDDRMKGGLGADTFVFDIATDTGADMIRDFDTTEDVLQLHGLAPGALTAVQDGGDTLLQWGDATAGGEVRLRDVAQDDLMAASDTVFDFG
jgi:Ca2+-binding RTX toxin-like protein